VSLDAVPLFAVGMQEQTAGMRRAMRSGYWIKRGSYSSSIGRCFL
jgi:hypothetical protein